MSKATKNIIRISTIIFVFIFGTFMISYLFILPSLVSNPDFIDKIEHIAQKNYNADLEIINPALKTSLTSIKFKTDALTLKQNNILLLDLENFNCEINLSRIFLRKIMLKQLGADEIYADINGLQKLTFKEQKKKESKKSFIKFDCKYALFYIKKCTILYTSEKDVKMRLLARDLEISNTRDPKYVHFGIFLDLNHNNDHLKLFFKDRDNVFFKDGKFQADNFKFRVNNSEITVNATLDRKNNYDLTLSSDKFEINNVNLFLNTDLFIENGSSYVSMFNDFKGDFDFKINIKNNGVNSYLKVNKVSAKYIPMANIPITVTDGVFKLDSKDIKFENFKGFYGLSSSNKINMTGEITDYVKNSNLKLIVSGIANNEFANYLSKMIGFDLSVTKTADVDAEIICQGPKTFIKGSVLVPKGSDILFDKTSIGNNTYHRSVDIDMEFFKEFLTINHINYYISEQKNKLSQKPLVTMNSKINIITGAIKKLEFSVPTPLPSEFLNVLIGQRIFRFGTFSGEMKYVDSPNPHLETDMNLKDAIIIGQATLIKNMQIISDKQFVKVKSDGFIRLAKYKFDTKIVNKMVFPIVIADANFTADNVDVEKIMKTFAPRPKNPPKREPRDPSKMPKIAKSDVPVDYFNVEEKQIAAVNANENPTVNFQPNIIQIKKCSLNIENGIYKKIKLGNLHSDLTLTPGGILETKSNKFDFADGISTLKIYCDFAKQKYSIRLGAKDVDIDAISSSILNIEKEISGKTSALLEFYTDENAKLNGKIQFELKDGTISKLGLVQYILNAATIFRNPLTMVSPSTLFDLFNIPDGSFSQIKGTLVIKDNVVEKMMIKSTSPKISSFIIGKINLETMDVSMNIYTKISDKHTGFFGALRDVSINSIAQKASSFTKEDMASYYEAEIALLPPLEIGDETAHVYLTQINGDITTTNYISILKKIK